jgi:hypothetical protein
MPVTGNVYKREPATVKRQPLTDGFLRRQVVSWRLSSVIGGRSAVIGERLSVIFSVDKMPLFIRLFGIKKLDLRTLKTPL